MPTHTAQLRTTQYTNGMIKILHFFPKDDKMIAQHVDILCNAMGSYAESYASCEPKDFIPKLHDKHPNIVHLHGCWRMANWIAARKATGNGARIVISPHGGLEPWIVKQQYWSRKLPQLVLYQRHIVKHAAAVIVMGRMEKGCLERLNLTQRIETILNSLITSALTDEQMAAATHAVYRKVLDSNVWPLMEEDTKVAARALIKAGITGDSRWIDNDGAVAVHGLTPDEQRKIALYAYQEGISSTVNQGFAATNTALPDIDPATVPQYMSRTETGISIVPQDVDGINEKVVAALKTARKLDWTGKLTTKNIVELDTLMRSGEIDEANLAETLREKHLLSFANRMMAVMNRTTGFDEGLMPVAMKEGRRAKNMIRRL